MKRYFFILFAFFFCFSPLSARAAASEWQRDEEVGVRLISGTNGVGTAQEVALGLEIELAEGWHTYWRDPGPLGLPPKIDWKGSEAEGNLLSAELLYPAPIKFGEPGFESVGYKGRVVLPISAKLKEAGKPLSVDAPLDLLICSAICVPKRFTLRLKVPAGEASPSQEAALIDEALATVPANSTPANFAPVAANEGNSLTNAEPLLAQAPPTAPLWAFIVLAILGGFILNLTPCVLPVLSLKILSVIKHGGAKDKTIRRSFLTTASGILFSFLVLASITTALKQAGIAVGWGMQFQQPVFLALLVFVLAMFSANLWGLYEIQLPRFLADRLDSHHHPRLAGDFVTGAFATLLATPCTAPFLGTAVGFALSQGPKEIFTIFMALGCGMILPYLGFALWPKMASCLPRPGKWMLVMRHCLGSLLALTAGWITYVLSSQIALVSVGAIACSTAGIIAALALSRHRRSRGGLTAASVGTLAALALIAALTASPPARKAAPDDVAWRTFDEKALEGYIREGKTVFVDISADWCVNCKANKRFTLARQEVARCLFENPDIIAMRADYTNPSPEIADFLKRHGRYGIPFNAIFGPAEPGGKVLPELLTPDAVIENLQKAQTPPSTC